MNLSKDVIENYLRLLEESSFNEDYFEKGIEKRISGYEKFHWIPTRSYSEAIDIVDNFEFNTAIDYGCAKGFMVHALRQLGKTVYGEDISDYAINNCDKRVKEYLSKPTMNKADLIICKDVAEHIPENEMIMFLNLLYFKAIKNIFMVIPLGDDNMFRIREYEIDKTHITKKDEDWWIDKFKEVNLKLIRFSYNFGSIKEKWTKEFPYGNGFFLLEKI